jgi:hypothetical protein
VRPQRAVVVFETKHETKRNETKRKKENETKQKSKRNKRKAGKRKMALRDLDVVAVCTATQEEVHTSNQDARGADCRLLHDAA